VEVRRLGASGFNVPVLSFGAGTFGGKGEFFRWPVTSISRPRDCRQAQVPQTSLSRS
jgi:aryl-alcohol dehydrogenase-like predicted oxidoreductase